MSCQGIFQKTGSLAQPFCNLIQAGGLLLLDAVGSALSTLSLQVQAKHRVEASLEKQTAQHQQKYNGKQVRNAVKKSA